MSGRSILARIANNWPAKVFSIALAMVLFVFHRMNSLAERFFLVPLVLESQTSLVPAASYPRMIRVTLRGDANGIFPIQEEDIQAYVDLSKYHAPGNYQAVVEIRKRGMALDVSPLEIRIEPGEIPLALDHRISKFVSLKANIEGEVEPGFVFNSHTLNPTQVVIDGPSGYVSGISELDTEAVDLSGRDHDFIQTVNILNRDPLLVIRGSGVTEFRGFISRIITVRNIPNAPVAVTGLSGQFTAELETKTAALRLEGKSQEELDRFVLPRNFLFVDCSAIQEPGAYMLKIQGEVSPNLVFSADPPEIMVRISAVMSDSLVIPESSATPESLVIPESPVVPGEEP